jgi:hypothetical protein
LPIGDKPHVVDAAGVRPKEADIPPKSLKRNAFILKSKPNPHRFDFHRAVQAWLQEPNVYVVGLKDHRDAAYYDALAPIIRKFRSAQTLPAVAAHSTSHHLLALSSLVT